MVDNNIDTTFKIERMKNDDLQEVLQIERMSFIDPWALDAFTSELTNPFSRPIVAKSKDGTIVGYAIYWIAGPEVHLLNIAVKPQYRRRGIGCLLMKHIVEESRKGDAKMIFLEVRVSNHVAKSFYTKWGFQKVGLRRRYYSNGEDAEILMLLL